MRRCWQTVHVFNGDTDYITQLKQQKNKKGAITFAAHCHMSTCK